MATEDLKVRISAETEDTEKKIEGVDGLFDDLAGTVKSFALGAAAAIGAFALAMGVKAVQGAEDLERAVNDVTTQTGASTSEMGEFRNILKSLYGQNFGESFQDLGKSLAEVKKQTNLSGKELENFTKNALILADTFDFDVVESTRAAQMLVKQFGISGEEAFNLIAQGAQKGLNKNDDLLDTINEYSVQFKSIGLDADQMFEMLASGAESGAWSIDKVGDAVKEFNIRAKDGSKTSAKGFKDLGMDADAMFKKFASGGESAKTAFFDVITQLGKVKEKTKQNEIGVALFGTQFEDLEASGILALGNIGKKFDQTKNTMNSINAIRYNTFGEAVKGIGRQLEVGILIPIGEAILPMLNTFSNWLKQFIPAGIGLFKQMANYVKSIFGPVFIYNFQAIKGLLSEFIKNLGSTKGQATPIFNALKDLFKTLAGVWKIYSDIIIKQVLPAFLSIITTLIPVIGVVFLGVIKALKVLYTVWGFIWGNIGRLVGQIWTSVASIIKNNMNIIRGVINIISGLIKGDWSAVWTGIKMIVKGIFGNIGTLIKLGLTMWKTIFSITLTVIKGIIKIAFTVIKGIIKGAMLSAKYEVNAILGLITNTFKTKGANIKNAISNIATSAKNILTGIAKSAYNWGVNFLSAFTRGIKAKIGELRGMVSRAAQELKNILGFSSPTKKGPGRTAHKWAPNFMRMYAKGLFGDINLITRAATVAAYKVRPSTVPNVRAGGAAGNTINISGNNIPDQAFIDALLQKAIRMMANRGR